MQAIGNWFWNNDSLLEINLFNQCIASNANRIYEVLRVVNGKALFVEDHFARFMHSCNELKLRTPVSIQYVQSCINKVITRNNIDTCNIRFEQILEENNASFACYLVPFAYPAEELYKRGIKVCTYEIERANPHIKQAAVNNRIRNTISQLFVSKNVFEVLLVNHLGQVTEGSRSNVFFVKDNTLFSPPSANLLEGITRQKVLEIAQKERVNYLEKPILYKELNNFDACFITGTSPKVLPICQLNKLMFDVSNPLVNALADKYNALIYRT